MLKFLKELWVEFTSVQKEYAQMGIYHFPTATGFWTYVDQEALKSYMEKKVEGDQSSTK